MGCSGSKQAVEPEPAPAPESFHGKLDSPGDAASASLVKPSHMEESKEGASASCKAGNHRCATSTPTPALHSGLSTGTGTITSTCTCTSD